MINIIKGHFEEVDRDKYLIISSENGENGENGDGIKEIIKKINDYSYPIK